MEDLKVLIIGHTWPEPKATAAGGRMMELIHFFLTQGCQISFGSTAANQEQAISLEELGIQTVRLLLNHHSFDTFLQQLKPDFVLFDRYITEEQFGWRVTEGAPNAVKILDTEDLHSLRLSRKESLEGQIEFTNSLWIQHELTKREVASIYRCDLTLIISKAEMQLLTKELHIPESLLLYLPYMLNLIDDAARKNWLRFKSREHFVFIGTGKHPPNVDAIKWLKKAIWPLIKKKLPESQLHIYGAYLPQSILALNQTEEGFYVKGFVMDAALAMSRARVNLVPLRYGAGIKGKLILAMRQGTPNIATRIGAEGVDGDFSSISCENNNAEEFAKQAVELYTDKSQWDKMQLNGISIINEQFNKAVHQNTLNKRLGLLLKELEQHRIKNFTGAMLMHHTMRASKYLSKWIAAKNASEIN